ncbi:hypothetical protein C4577_01285 [Candidatus Parcubacteria bacterium]|nr:MAG: hypothetical protein C4577_01285 [Candidatus Parcubacteria bacterium]
MLKGDIVIGLQRLFEGVKITPGQSQTLYMDPFGAFIDPPSDPTLNPLRGFQVTLAPGPNLPLEAVVGILLGLWSTGKESEGMQPVCVDKAEVGKDGRALLAASGSTGIYFIYPA